MQSSAEAKRRPSRKKKPEPSAAMAVRAASAVAVQMPEIPAEEALSFLKETRGALTWTTRDMADSLKVAQTEAEQVIAILRLQGYVKAAAGDEGWLTTLDGETVSDSKLPRYSLKRMIEALSDLEARIKEINEDPHAGFHIAEAVAFGDFLRGGPRVQAADVGMRLVRRASSTSKSLSSLGEHAFRKQLRAKSALLHLLSLQPWMVSRSHRKLM